MVWLRRPIHTDKHQTDMHETIVHWLFLLGYFIMCAFAALSSCFQTICSPLEQTEERNRKRKAYLNGIFAVIYTTGAIHAAFRLVDFDEVAGIYEPNQPGRIPNECAHDHSEVPIEGSNKSQGRMLNH